MEPGDGLPLADFKWNDSKPITISTDALLYDENGKYFFTRARLDEAVRQCWQRLKMLVDTGKCVKLVAMCGLPGCGKSTWVQQFGALEGDGVVFFDDLLYSPAKRKAFFDHLSQWGIQVPVEIVVVQRDWEIAVASMKCRPNGFQVPMEAMERFRSQFEVPCMSEGFGRVRIMQNNYSDDTQKGSYSLVSDSNVL